MLDDGGIASAIGVVVIGRNEGDRLRRCLLSGIREVSRIVYVDSHSTDDSVELARSLGIETIELDSGAPLSAARARNEGFGRLRAMHPSLEYVQFVDGDCELCNGWLASAAEFLRDHEDAAVVCGQLREKFPENSIYNTLCNMEWDVPSGEAKECGGIAMMRASAFERVQGFRADLIAGEEPELCVRLRKQGWRIWRLRQPMALHDSAMLRFGQWWKREQRAGYAFAQGAELHGAPPVRHYVRECRSALFWGLGVPLIALALIVSIGPFGVLVFAIYPLQVLRLGLKGSRSVRENWLRAIFLVIGKFPEMLGELKFYVRRILGRQSRLIELLPPQSEHRDMVKRPDRAPG
jgi:GT2 family glycosyltransferase